MSDDLDRLKWVAEQATAGPWFAEDHGVMNAARSYTMVLFGDSRQDSADAGYIATFDPPTVLDLIARIRELEARL